MRAWERKRWWRERRRACLRSGKTLSYSCEDDHLIQGPDRIAGRDPGTGWHRSGRGVHGRADCSWRIQAPSPGTPERRSGRLAAVVPGQRVLRADRIGVDRYTVKYLVDANVLSEPTKPTPHAGVVGWLRRNETEIVVDPVILGEIRFGILLLPRGNRRTRLERWFDEGVRRMVCLPWEAETGFRWAGLLATLRASGRAMPVKDSLIAATALVHGLAVVTRNRADFEKAGVAIINPFTS